MDLSSASFVPCELALNIPFIQHPDTQYQIQMGTTARGNAALVCAEDSLFSFLEREVLMFLLLFLLFLIKPDQGQCQKKLLRRTPTARFNPSVEKVLCFFSSRPGFSGVNWFADFPPISWLRELSACSESLPEFPRTVEAFPGSAGPLLCLSGEGQTSFRVPRNIPAKSRDVLGFFSPHPYVNCTEGMRGLAFSVRFQRQLFF